MKSKFKVGDIVIYESSDTAYSIYNGFDAEVMRVIDKPDALHNSEILPMYEIRINTLTYISIEARSDELKLAIK